MIVAFASTAGLTGIELGIAGGSAALGQKVLETIFGDEAVRKLASEAQQLLANHVQELLDQEQQRFLAVLPTVEKSSRLADVVEPLNQLAKHGQTTEENA